MSNDGTLCLSVASRRIEYFRSATTGRPCVFELSLRIPWEKSLRYCCLILVVATHDARVSVDCKFVFVDYAAAVGRGDCACFFGFLVGNG